MQTKLAILQSLMQAGDWDKALAIAAKFPRLGRHKAAIIRGHEVVAYPRFYQQIGINLADARQAGIAALQNQYARP